MRKIVKCFLMSFVLFAIILFNFNFSIAKVVDSDNDGWPDKYEEKLGVDPNDSKDTPDPIADNDQDGLVNEKERDYGTDPTDPDTDNDNLSDSQEVTWKKSDPCDSDTDNDGLNDYNELLNGTNPRLPDSDGDEWLDKAEIDAVSDPNDYSSTPNDL
jgi:hypothetical protein